MPSAADLELLVEFRAQHLPMLLDAFGEIRRATQKWPCGRSGRLNTATILEKLQREKTALHRMQDVAGIRIVLQEDRSRRDQDDVVRSIVASGIIQDCVLCDRRQQPSCGYRAVHVVGERDGLLVEIQVRTHLQHVWAQVYEYFADMWGRGIRYGGQPSRGEDPYVQGATVTRNELLVFMQELAEDIAEVEALVCNENLQSSHRQKLKSLVTSLRTVLVVMAADGEAQADALTGLSQKDMEESAFLVVYDRSTARALEIRPGRGAELLSEWRRLDVQHRTNEDMEIVLLASESREALLQTHGRYFRAAPDLAGDGTEPMEF